MGTVDYMADFEEQIREADGQKPRASLTEEDRVFAFLDEQRGVKFKPRDIAHLTDIKPNTVYTSLVRLLKKGKIFQVDKNYYVPQPAKEVNPFQMTAEAFDLGLPLNMGEFARVSRGDMVIVAGEKSSGKSGILGETAILNMSRIHINYIVTENIRKIANRFLAWGYTEDQIMRHMSFIEARARNYDNVIKPDSLNVVDYYNPKDGDYTRVAKELEGMAAQLGSGVLVVGIQKATGAAYARGGELSNELSQLTIVLEVIDYHGSDRIARAKMQIIKEDGIRPGGEGKICEYTFTPKAQGSRIVQSGTWDWPKGKKS